MPRFNHTLHLTQKPALGVVCLSIATSESRVDEITVLARDFKEVAHALWNKTSHYTGCMAIQGKYKEGFFSLSVETGPHTRAVYRLKEHEVMPTLAQYMADTGGE
jgi:hypothetical protein